MEVCEVNSLTHYSCGYGKLPECNELQWATMSNNVKYVCTQIWHLPAIRKFDVEMK